MVRRVIRSEGRHDRACCCKHGLGFGFCKACHTRIIPHLRLVLKVFATEWSIQQLGTEALPGSNGLEASLNINGGMGLLWVSWSGRQAVRSLYPLTNPDI